LSLLIPKTITLTKTKIGKSLKKKAFSAGLMQLYDVGMTSMFVQEAFALAELAQLIGEPQALTDMLTKRGTDMAQLIR
jgi:hypothetical protein